MLAKYIFVICSHWLLFHAFSICQMLFSHYLMAFLVDPKSYLVWYVQQRSGLE